MRFLGYRGPEGLWIGEVADDGRTIQPVAALDEFYDDPFAMAARSTAATPMSRSSVEEAPPVPTSARVFCIGLNYQSHIDEIALPGRSRPEAPTVFGRWYSCLSTTGADVPVPVGEPGLDWEGELAVIVGRRMVDVDPETAMAGVLGYTVFNDLSARTYQRRTSQFTLGKNADASGPIGPSVVTADAYGDPYGRLLETRVNGETVQSSTTDQMIFRIGETLSYISRVMTLEPGDVLATGTPDGVGIGRDPVWLLQPGDEVEVEIDGIGVLRSTIV